jgi:hypothetical protein
MCHDNAAKIVVFSATCFRASRVSRFATAEVVRFRACQFGGGGDSSSAQRRPVGRQNRRRGTDSTRFAGAWRLQSDGSGFCRVLSAQCGAVTFVQRFGSSANLHLHFHVLAIVLELPG